MISLHASSYEASWRFGISKETSNAGHITLSEGGRQRALVEDDQIILKISNDELVLKRAFFHLNRAMFNHSW